MVAATQESYTQLQDDSRLGEQIVPCRMSRDV